MSRAGLRPGRCRRAGLLHSAALRPEPTSARRPVRRWPAAALVPGKPGGRSPDPPRDRLAAIDQPDRPAVLGDVFPRLIDAEQPIDGGGVIERAVGRAADPFAAAV